MSDDHKCSGDHEHNADRVFLTLTPSGLQLNILSVAGELREMLEQEKYAEAKDLVDMVGQMLVAAYRGDYELLDRSYDDAVADHFAEQLKGVDDVLAVLDKEDKGE